MSEISETVPDPATTRRLQRQRFVRLLAWTLIIFVCGGAAGWGVSILCRRPPAMGMGFGPEPPVNDMVHRLQEELLLSDDQAKQIRQIYQEREEALRSIRQKMEPEMKAEYDKLDAQIKGVLNPAQYQRWSERFQSMRNRMLPPPGGPHQPGMDGGPPPFGAGPRGPRFGGPPGESGGPEGPRGPDGQGPDQRDRPGNHGPPPGGMPPP